MTDLIPGGLAAGMRPSDFDSTALKQGTLVELEHTSSWGVAQEIAMDHLVEDPDYYDKLAVMEAQPNYLANALVPLSALGDDFEENPAGMAMFWTLVSAAGAGLSSYHGYKRNAASNPIAWALWWGLWGSVLPIITLPIAIAQGYAEPE